MFPAGIYYVQTRGLPCLYEQTCLSNSVCPLYVQTRGCASSVRAGFSLLTRSVYIYVLIQKNNLQPWRVLVFDTSGNDLIQSKRKTYEFLQGSDIPSRPYA